MDSPFLYRFVMRPTYLDIILDLGHGMTVKRLSERAKIRYHHLINVMREADKEGYIERELTKDNDYLLSLSPKGKELLSICRSIKRLVDDWEDENKEEVSNATTTSTTGS